MALCPECGSQVEDAMRFCPACGRSLESGGAPTVQAQGTNDVGLEPQLGHARLLSVLCLGELISVGLLLAAPPAPSAIRTAALALLVLTTVLSAEFVHRDALAINRERGFKALDATAWSLLAFILGPISVPWYTLVRRKEAMTAEPGSKSRYQRAFVLGSVGTYLTVFGISGLEPNSLFLTPQENLGIAIVGIAAGLMVMGIATMAYRRAAERGKP